MTNKESQHVKSYPNVSDRYFFC